MAKIGQLNLTRLTNGAHFNFMESILGRAKKETILNSKAAGLVSDLETALGAEDECLQVSRKSFRSDDIAQADTERDTLYVAYKRTVQSYLCVQNEERNAAARLLNQHIKDYSIDVRTQMFRETGMLTNFISDLEDRLAQQVKSLGLTQLVADMKNANDRVKQATQERVEEQPSNITAKMKNARLATDTAYEALTEKVNALANVFGEADYLPFITYVNTEIREYRIKALGQKAPSTPDTGTGGDTPGTGGEGGGSGTPGTGDNTGGNTGTGGDGGNTGDDGGTSFD